MGKPNNAPKVLYFPSYKTSLQWMGERTIEIGTKKRTEKIKKIVDAFSKTVTPAENRISLAKDFDRARIYINLKKFATEAAKFAIINKIKKDYLSPWVEKHHSYTQGDFSGGICSSIFPGSNVNSRAQFAYFDNQGERCGIEIIIDKDDPSQWFISISRRSDQTNIREIKLFYSHHHDGKDLDGTYKQTPANEPTLQSIQEQFFSFLNSKDLEEEFANLFQMQRNKIILKQSLVKKFQADKRPFHQHIYEFNAKNEPLLTSKTYISKTQKVAHAAKNIFGYMLGGASIGFGIGIPFGVATLGIGFVISLITGAVLGTLFGFYDTLKLPLRSKTYSMPWKLEPIPEEKSHTSETPESPRSSSGFMQDQLKQQNSIAVPQASVEEVQTANAPGFDKLFTVYNKNAEETPKIKYVSYFKGSKELQKSYTVLEDSVRLKI